MGFLAAAGCGQSPTAPTPAAPSQVELITYTGMVFEPYVPFPDGTSKRGTGAYFTPIPGARVTIGGGQPDGRTAVTEGRFAFEDYPKCDLESAECLSRRFRVEKAGYETRELGASDPYLRTNSSRPQYSASEKLIPMGYAWPDDPKIQQMRRDLPAVRPLFLFENPYLKDLGYAGTYVAGRITVANLDGSSATLHTLAHEYCHAHQESRPARWAL